MLIQAFCQTFLIHRQGINVNAVNAVSDVIQHFLFDPVAHIGNDNVGAGTFADRMHFHNKFRRADAAADQRRVEDHSLHKAVPAPPKGLVLVRLRGGPLGIGALVDQHALVHSIHEHRPYSRQYLPHDGVLLPADGHLTVGDTRL